MNKPTSSLGALLARLFPTSHKAISEKLTTTEFNAFAAEAGVLEGDPVGETIIPTVEAIVVAAEAVTPVEAVVEAATGEPGDPAGPEGIITPATPSAAVDYPAQISALESQVATLTADKAAAIQQAADLQTQLTAKEGYITKLKASVNPLASEDASNTGGDEVLTDTDRKARANSIRNQQV